METERVTMRLTLMPSIALVWGRIIACNDKILLFMSFLRSNDLRMEVTLALEVIDRYAYALIQLLKTRRAERMLQLSTVCFERNNISRTCVCRRCVHQRYCYNGME